MFKCFAFVLLTTAGTLALAQENGWISLGSSTDGSVYTMKAHSAIHTTNALGQPMTVVVGQVDHPNTHQSHIMKFGVSDADCSQGYGKLVVLSIDGTFVEDAAFAGGGISIANSIADGVCIAVKSDPAGGR